MHWRDVKLPKLNAKSLQYVLCGVLMIALLLLCWPQLFAFGKTEQTQTEDTSSSTFNAETEKQRLASILSSIKGAGAVEVMITYEGEAEKVPGLRQQLYNLFHRRCAEQKHDQPIHLHKACLWRGGSSSHHRKAPPGAGGGDRSRRGQRFDRADGAFQSRTDCAGRGSIQSRSI